MIYHDSFNDNLFNTKTTSYNKLPKLVFILLSLILIFILSVYYKTNLKQI